MKHLFIFIAFLSAFPAFAEETAPAPTVKQVQAALAEANAESGYLSSRAENLAGALQGANDEISSLKAKIATLEPSNPKTGDAKP